MEACKIRLQGWTAPSTTCPLTGWSVMRCLTSCQRGSLASTAALQCQAHCRMSTAPLRCLYGTRLPNMASPRPRPDGAAPAAAAASLTVAGALDIQRVRQHRAKGVRPLSDAGCAAQASPAQAQHKPPGSHSKLRSDSTSHMCPANGAPAASPQLPPLAPRQSPQPCMPAAAEAGAQPRLCHSSGRLQEQGLSPSQHAAAGVWEEPSPRRASAGQVPEQLGMLQHPCSSLHSHRSRGAAEMQLGPDPGQASLDKARHADAAGSECLGGLMDGDCLAASARHQAAEAAAAAGAEVQAAAQRTTAQQPLLPAGHSSAEQDQWEDIAVDVDDEAPHRQPLQPCSAHNIPASPLRQQSLAWPRASRPALGQAPQPPQQLHQQTTACSASWRSPAGAAQQLDDPDSAGAGTLHQPPPPASSRSRQPEPAPLFVDLPDSSAARVQRSRGSEALCSQPEPGSGGLPGKHEEGGGRAAHVVQVDRAAAEEPLLASEAGEAPLSSGDNDCVLLGVQPAVGVLRRQAQVSARVLNWGPGCGLALSVRC